MAKLVILKFNGYLQSGFQVSLEIGEEGKFADRSIAGSLPPAPKLNEYLGKWQQQYRQLDNNNRIKPQQIIYNGLSLSQKHLISLGQKLQQELQQWLDSPSFSLVDKYLRSELNRQEAIRMIICSDRPELYQLPWCCWDLVENYPLLEIAVSNFNFERVPTTQPQKQDHRVRILAILGDAHGINLDVDRDFLNSLHEGEVVFLVEPTPQELYERLWHETWDIIFFAGHSQTIARQGILSLNRQDNLTIEQLRHGFKKAIASGLHLAIFNSCDGLGLAEELGQLSLPQSIVMRMPIPDLVAQNFAKYFLQAYAEGNSLYIAVRIAREQLQSWETQFPCASWLPTIYQNPAIIPPSWQNLKGNHLSAPSSTRKSNTPQKTLTAICLISAIATMIVWLIQSLGWLQAAELRTYDRFTRWRPVMPADERVLVVTIDDRDIQYQQEQGTAMNMRGSLADSVLNQLLHRIQPWQPKAIASDVIHDFPFEPELAQTVAKSDNFFAICRIKIDRSKVSLPPPSQLPTEQVGFSNWAIDDDGVIRRQILGMSPDNVCQSDLSLSLRLALKYLEDKPASLNSQGLLTIGTTTFPKLEATSGGYHLPEARGYQVLLNYRRALPQIISLETILTMPEKELSKLVKNKIILIGVQGLNHDLHHTPYSRGQQVKRLPGVVIHSQMTSHITSVVLGEQKLLWWSSDKVELLWIAIWSIIGSGIVFCAQGSLIKITAGITVLLAILFACCWLLFLNSVWIVAIAPVLSLLLSATLKSMIYD